MSRNDPSQDDSLVFDESQKKKTIGLTRKRADELIELVIQRANVINADPDQLHRILRLVVFGSYLTAKERLGDLDIAVEHERKIADGDEYMKANAALRHREKPNTKLSFIDELGYSERKVLVTLKGRSTAISLHSYGEFELMVKKGLAVGKPIFP